MMKQIKKLLPFLVLATTALYLSGCASNLMRSGSSQKIVSPNQDRASIVFMRSSFVAGALGVEMFEVIDGDLKFIGQLPMGNKIVYETTPGKKVFMAYGAAADFMTAEVVGGKTYYVIVRPNWGTGGFAPTPIRADDSPDFNMNSGEFAGWVSGTTLIEPNEDAQSWFAENKVRYQGIYNEYWYRFQGKSNHQKAQRALRPEDGVTTPF